MRKSADRRPGFEEFVDGGQARWLRAAYAMTGSWAAAEDVVQTVLTRLYPRWPKVGKLDSPERYVQRALINAVVDERRRPWRREVAFADLPDTPMVQPDDDLPDLVNALLRLPPGQRAVLVLRFLHDLDTRETAYVLDCSTGTVKSQTSHGLRRLREILPDPTTQGPMS